ncbi:roundabout homolog 2-like [Ischnura elegans]|uniref:roundabout homolog 2-like n=1 Tax=Ischnura elegans TaxID=197161 RepID=UPI001ED8BB89|nr:roundabout homolog 2-like [Ischnura elegans]XP_046388579.1 roundabout homolog 2-like [Ischnura elegans]
MNSENLKGRRMRVAAALNCFFLALAFAGNRPQAAGEAFSPEDLSPSSQSLDEILPGEENNATLEHPDGDIRNWPPLYHHDPSATGFKYSTGLRGSLDDLDLGAVGDLDADGNHDRLSSYPWQTPWVDEEEEEGEGGVAGVVDGAEGEHSAPTATGGGAPGEPYVAHPPPQPPPPVPPTPAPSFANEASSNVSAQLGATAFLHCHVRNLGQRTVSWVRRRDWHILTSGLFTYTNDERFQVIHSHGSDDWTLQIKYVQTRDNGTYECQVSTGAGRLSHLFHLRVVVPEAIILGSGEYHVGEGSAISLVCIIENSPVPPQYVFWYHNDRMITYDTSRPGSEVLVGPVSVSVSTEPGPKTHSRLLISHATLGHSGNYTCRASNSNPSTIHVFVSRGDNTAAIQGHESSSTAAFSLRDFHVTLIAAILSWVGR